MTILPQAAANTLCAFKNNESKVFSTAITLDPASDV